MSGNAAETNLGEWWHPSRVVNGDIRDWVAPYRRLGYFDLLEGKPYPAEYDDWDIFDQKGYEDGRLVVLEMMTMGINPKWSPSKAVPDAFISHKAILDRLSEYRNVRICAKARQDNENAAGYFVRHQLETLNAIIAYVQELIGIEAPDGSPLTAIRRRVRVRGRRSIGRAKHEAAPQVQTMERKMI